jgi:perosamine synthetase
MGLRDIQPTPRFIDHGRPWPVYSAEAIERCTDLLRAGRSYDYGRDDEIAVLEDALAVAHDRRYALAVNSGTSALFLAYLALGVRPGDEVLVPTFTFAATATPLLLLGARPVLVDSGDDTGNITAASLAPHITPRTVGIAVTHLYGHPCEMRSVVALAKRSGLFVIEDCSHAHGSTERGRSVGTWGDVAIYSLGGRKMVSGGMAGVLLCDDPRVFDLACIASSFPSRTKISLVDDRLDGVADLGLGGNLRTTPVAAVLAHSLLRMLPTLVRQKERLVDRLLDGLCALDGLSRVPSRVHCVLGARFGVHVRVDQEACGRTRDEVVTDLVHHGLRVGGPQAMPLHTRPIFNGGLPAGDIRLAHHPLSFVCDPDSFPIADRLASTWLGLPADYFHGESTALVDHYVTTFSKVWSKQ